MFGKKSSRLLALVIVVAASRTLIAHAAPWDKLIGNVDADPKKSYQLTEENGPWMVMACSFSGQEADQQAKDLVLELRKKFKLSAYTYKKRFDFGKIEEAGVDRYNRPLKPKYLRGLDEVEETAVLVGNCQVIDAPEAQDLLQKIKTIRPECLEAGKKTSRTLAGWREFQQIWAPSDSELKKEGPMNHAFLTTNPLLPKDYFTKGVSSEVAMLNKGLEHSLLDCPGKYTVRVARFTGNVVIDPKEIRAINAGVKEMKNHLDEAAKSAHLMTLALRKKGVEAYEFHDLQSSIVTVGSFKSIGKSLPNGKIELTPEIYKIIQEYGSDQSQMNMPGEQIKVKACLVDGKHNVPFDVSPIPIDVPKRSITADYRRDLLGRK